MDGKTEEVVGVYAERPTEDKFVLDPHVRQAINGQRIVILEDVVTTGKAVKGVVALAKGAGAEIVRVGALVNRSSREAKVTAATLDVPVFSFLLETNDEAWEAPCKLCLDGVLVNTEFGKGAQYLAERAAAPK